MKKSNLLKSMLGLMMATVLFTGCGTSNDMMMQETMNAGSSTGSYSNSVSTESVAEFEMYDQSAAMPGMNASASTTTAQVQDPLADRKLIKTVDMSVETKEFDKLLGTLESRVTELGGYIESLETFNGSIYYSHRNSRDANMTIRIPKDKLDVFLDEVGSISNVLRRSENVQDVTLTYVDLESHKKVLEAERDRLIELIDQAEYLEDILTIEKRLTEVRYQLESMEAQLRTYDNKIDYSTIDLYIEEVLELTPVEEETIGQRISGGFVESLDDIGTGFLEFVIWFIVSIPYFIVWAIVIVVIIFIIKGLKKVLKLGKKNKKNKQTGEQDERETKL